MIHFVFIKYKKMIFVSKYSFKRAGKNGLLLEYLVCDFWNLTEFPPIPSLSRISLCLYLYSITTCSLWWWCTGGPSQNKWSCLNGGELHLAKSSWHFKSPIMRLACGVTRNVMNDSPFAGSNSIDNRNSHCVMTILTNIYHCNGISCTGKAACLYWNGPHFS